MRFSDVKNDDLLWDFMTEPSSSFIECLSLLNGPLMVLGGSGKMGKELIGMVIRGDRSAGITREIMAASTFSSPCGSDLQLLQSLNVMCYKGNLTDKVFLNSLPDTSLVIYMMGFKFGSGQDWRKAFHLNSIVPYLIGEKYRNSRIVVFSSGNPYPYVHPGSGGCVETESFDPQGIYGWSIVARESAFSTTALHNKEQRLCFFRLMYAQHLCYGVLVDLAKMVWNDEPVSVAMPFVNLISQRDANDAAIRSLEKCKNPSWILNAAGQICSVKSIIQSFGSIMKKTPRIVDEEPETALLANDSLCRTTFGPYRDTVEEMIEAAAWWVMNGGTNWNKPTLFGKVQHDY